MTSQHTEALDKQLVEQTARAATGNKRQGGPDSFYTQGNGGTQHPDPRSLQLCPNGGWAESSGLQTSGPGPFFRGAEKSGVEVPVPEKKGLCSCPGCERGRRGLTFPDRVPPPVPLSQILNPSHLQDSSEAPPLLTLATCPRPPPKRQFPPLPRPLTRGPIAAQSFGAPAVLTASEGWRSLRHSSGLARQALSFAFAPPSPEPSLLPAQ